MKKRLLLAATFILLIYTVKAQTKNYAIQSIEGTPQVVSVIDGPESRDLSIKYKSTKITVTNYWALNNITLIKNKFLKISYAVRGGSCVGVEYVILVCISRDKLIVPVNLHTMQSGCGADEDDMYMLKFNITGSNNQFKMNVHIHDQKEIGSPKRGKSYDRHWTTRLNFDPKTATFSNGSKTLNDNFITGFANSDKPLTQSIKGVFPMISVKGIDGHEDEYYYVNGYWHEAGQKNYLLKNYR